MAGTGNMTEREQVAASVLAYGKALVPDRFPRPDAMTLQAWASALGDLRVPSQVWPEAIEWWSLNTVGDRMVTPRELKDAARHVIRGVWEADPEKRAILENHRIARLRAREARGELPPGTAPESPSDTAMGAIEARSDATAQQLQRLKDGIRDRARARRVAEQINGTDRGDLFATANEPPEPRQNES